MDIEYFVKSFSYAKPSEDQLKRIENVRSIYKCVLSSLYKDCKPSRELSIALTNLENSLMYAVKSIVLEDK